MTLCAAWGIAAEGRGGPTASISTAAASRACALDARTRLFSRAYSTSSTGSTSSQALYAVHPVQAVQAGATRPEVQGHAGLQPDAAARARLFSRACSAGSASRSGPPDPTCSTCNPHAVQATHMQYMQPTCSTSNPHTVQATHIQYKQPTYSTSNPHTVQATHMQYKQPTCSTSKPHAVPRLSTQAHSGMQGTKAVLLYVKYRYYCTQSTVSTMKSSCK